MDWTHSPCIGRWSLNLQGSPLQLVFTEYLFRAKSGTSDDLFLVPTFKRASQVVQWVKNPPADAGDAGDLILILGSERSFGGGYGNPLWYSYLENPMDRGVWWAIVQRGSVSRSWTRLKQWTHRHARTQLQGAPILVRRQRTACWLCSASPRGFGGTEKNKSRQPRAAENEASQTLKDRVEWAWLSR